MTPDTRLAGPLVPLADLVGLARLGQVMRKAQRNFYRLRKEQPHVNHEAAFKAALSAENAFDSAAADALARERQTLPGMADRPEPLSAIAAAALRTELQRLGLRQDIAASFESIIARLEGGGR